MCNEQQKVVDLRNLGVPEKEIKVVPIGKDCALQGGHQCTHHVGPSTFDCRGRCEDVDLDAENWLDVSEFNCVIASNEIFVACSSSLETGAPAVAKMQSNVQFTCGEINGWIVAMFENKRLFASRARRRATLPGFRR